MCRYPGQGPLGRDNGPKVANPLGSTQEASVTRSGCMWVARGEGWVWLGGSWGLNPVGYS